MEKKTVKTQGLTFGYTEDHGARWWVLRDLGVLGVQLRAAQLGVGAVLDGMRPQAARESALREWAEETRAESGATVLAWLDSMVVVLDGADAENVDLEVERQRASARTAGRVVDVGPTPAACVEDVEVEGYATIDWQTFIVDGDVRGISLRALVEAGLYQHMRDAARALRGGPFASCAVERTTRGDTGRDLADYIFERVSDAIAFAASARTPMGQRVLGLLVEHHEEFQRLLEGDEGEAAEVVEKVRSHRNASAPNVEQVDHLAVAEALIAQGRRARVERDMLRHEQETQRAELAEIQLELRRRPGDVSAATVANQFGLYSSSGRPHVQAVLAMARGWGFASAGLLRTIEVPADGRTSTDTHPMHVFNLKGAIRFGELLEEQHGDGAFDVVTASRTYAVCRRAVAS